MKTAGNDIVSSSRILTYNLAGMPKEIEAKFRIENPGEFRKRLLAAGANRLGKVSQSDTFFDKPDGSLRKADCGLRLRRSVSLDEGASPPQAVLTYKGPRELGANVKIRPETETTVGDADALAAVLTAAGLIPSLKIQKRRESFLIELDGGASARVELDQLPRLGHFVEIEAASESIVQQACVRLGLSGPSITAGYTHLACGYLREHGIYGGEFTFDTLGD
jgi:adenylate cyclase class 2